MMHSPQIVRCPYCGGVNAEHATYCVHCGRDLSVKPRQGPPQQQPVQPQYPPPRGPQYPPPAKPAQQPYTAPGRAPTAPAGTASATGRRAAAPAAPFVPPPVPRVPDPPAPFPPQKIEQLQALESGALAYTVVETSTMSDRKKTVTITYPRCAAWQQVATLLKAYKEQRGEKFATIIIRGYWQPEPDLYSFTNGQMIVDLGVLLGSQKINRYQIETDNGFEINAVRIVLSEPV